MKTSAPGVSFVIVYYTVRNDRKYPTRGALSFFVKTDDDDTVFKEDNEHSFSAINDAKLEYLDELQPGILKKSLAIFEIPDDQLKKHPVLLLGSVEYAQNKIAMWDGSIVANPKSVCTGEEPKTENSAPAPPVAETPQAQAPLVSEPTLLTAEEKMLIEHFQNLAKNTDESLKQAYSDFDNDWKAKQTYEQFAEANQTSKWAVQDKQELAIKKENKIDETHADVDLDMSMFSGENKTIRYSLQKNEDGWKISKGSAI